MDDQNIQIICCEQPQSSSERCFGQLFQLIYFEGKKQKIKIEFDNNQSEMRCLESIDKDELTIIKIFKRITIQNSYCKIQSRVEQQQVNNKQKENLDLRIQGYLFLGMLFFKKNETMIMKEENLINYYFKLHQNYHSKEINDIVEYVYSIINEDTSDQQIETDENSQRSINLSLNISSNQLQELQEKLIKIDEIGSKSRSLLKFQKFKQIMQGGTYFIINTQQNILFTNDNPSLGFQINNINDCILLCKGHFQQQKLFHQGEIVKFDNTTKQIIYYCQINVNADQEIESQRAKVYYYDLRNNINMLEYQADKIYHGELSNGQPNGEGYMVQYKNGEHEKYFKGNWKDGLLQGEGLFKFLGEFPINIQFFMYKGEFLDSKFHGQGTAYLNEKCTMYTKGKFEHGKMIGQHRMNLDGRDILMYYLEIGKINFKFQLQ